MRRNVPSDAANIPVSPSSCVVQAIKGSRVAIAGRLNPISPRPPPFRHLPFTTNPSKMHVLSLVPAFAGLASALTIQTRQSTTAPASVSIAGIAYAGSGCAASTLGASAVKQPGVIPVPRKLFVAKSGENNTKVVETRVNCQSTISLNHTAGWQYSVSEADYYGRVVLALGAEAISKTTYYFSGSTVQVRSRDREEGVGGGGEDGC